MGGLTEIIPNFFKQWKHLTSTFRTKMPNLTKLSHKTLHHNNLRQKFILHQLSNTLSLKIVKLKYWKQKLKLRKKKSKNSIRNSRKWLRIIMKYLSTRYRIKNRKKKHLKDSLQLSKRYNKLFYKKFWRPHMKILSKLRYFFERWLKKTHILMVWQSLLIYIKIQHITIKNVNVKKDSSSSTHPLSYLLGLIKK